MLKRRIEVVKNARICEITLREQCFRDDTQPVAVTVSEDMQGQLTHVCLPDGSEDRLRSKYDHGFLDRGPRNICTLD